MFIFYFSFTIFLHLFIKLINGQNNLTDNCLLTFGKLRLTSNFSLILCPSSCFTSRYITNEDEYPVIGNETYFGNSLICKAAMHDGRLLPWADRTSLVSIEIISSQSTTFDSSLRNGILSSKLTTNPSNSYRFTNGRINETSLSDIAIEHRRFLYSNDETSSVTCRSKDDIHFVEPINIDQGWKFWKENPLKYFTFPKLMTRNEALNFCSANNGTLFYWANSNEQSNFQNELFTTIHQLFHRQRETSGNNMLTFFIGLKRINRIQQWESNVVRLNETINVNTSSDNTNYCTIIQSSGENPSFSGIYSFACEDLNIRAYPFCRLLPSTNEEQTDFIYRVEKDTQSGNLTGVAVFCSQYGGYPIYANNAYEWQIIQEIMLNDPNFAGDKYAYTGLISETKRVNESYWMPRNVSYNSSLGFIEFGRSSGTTNIGFHLSKANDESYYLLYDIDPRTVLNSIRFCRKDDLRKMLKRSSTCDFNKCSSKCENITLPSRSDNLRFGFYVCMSKTSLASSVYTHSFPFDGDFIRPSLPMNYSVSLRQNSNVKLTFTLNQTDKDLRLDCSEYLNMGQSGISDDTISLICGSTIAVNKTISGITVKRNFNGLLSVGLQSRRIFSHHARFIDYQDLGDRCSYQGIYHPYVNQCICAPGFYGSQCQYSCPPGYYGQQCDFHCSGDDNYCKGLLICLPDPYGCSCYSGWYGTRCDLECPPNAYGPDCSYKCSCESSCNRFSGICNCNGTECYRGIYSRSEIENRCSSSSSNLAVLIAVPIVCVFVLSLLIGGLIFWKKRRSSDKQNLFAGRSVRFPSDSYSVSIQQDQFDNDYNNIISERL